MQIFLVLIFLGSLADGVEWVGRWRHGLATSGPTYVVRKKQQNACKMLVAGLAT